MSKRPWYGSILPANIRKICLAKPGAKAKALLYFDQSVLRILLREPENSPRWSTLKKMLGVPVGNALLEINFAFTPLMMWELAELVAPDPKNPQTPFRFSILQDGESIYKLFGEGRDFNLNNFDPKLDIAARIQERSKNWNWQETGLKQSLIRYVESPEAKWRQTLALYFGFQGLQEPELHPAGQLDRINPLIINLGLKTREDGDNQSLYRLFHRQLLKDIERNRSKGEKADPLLTKLDGALSKLKLNKDHVDLEYIHLSTAGAVIAKNVLPTISFTFDSPEVVESRLRLSGSAYRWIFRSKYADGVSLTRLMHGRVVSLKEDDFTILGVNTPHSSIFD